MMMMLEICFWYGDGMRRNAIGRTKSLDGGDKFVGKL
jgi:hypothetical protein